MIKTQVKLPMSVAFEVVLQGIRIRLGRSLVTTLGVALGIAFLMSILTGLVVKQGVGQEEGLRRETARMYNFLLAEMGLPRGRTVGVVQVGPLNPAEQRLLEQVAASGVAALRVAGGGANQEVFRRAAQVDLVPQPADTLTGSSAVIVVGDGPAPTGDWLAALATSGAPALCATRATNLPVPPAASSLKPVLLERQLLRDEVERQAAAARALAFRSTWIIIISLLVTIICISNSMLMSVTERFREIGTMKCLGALSSFVRQIFLIEASLVGLAGSLVGAVVGALFAAIAYMFTFGGGLVFAALGQGAFHLVLDLIGCIIAGIILSIIAALYPATIASRMVPAHALRSNI